MAQEMMENHDNRKSCTEDTWSTEYSPLAILPPGDLGRTTYGHSEICYPQAGMEETVLMLQFFGNADAYLNVEDKNQPLNQSSSIWLEQCTNRSNWSMVRSAEFFAVIFKKNAGFSGGSFEGNSKSKHPNIAPCLIWEIRMWVEKMREEEFCSAGAVKCQSGFFVIVVICIAVLFVTELGIALPQVEIAFAHIGGVN